MKKWCHTQTYTGTSELITRARTCESHHRPARRKCLITRPLFATRRNQLMSTKVPRVKGIKHSKPLWPLKCFIPLKFLFHWSWTQIVTVSVREGWRHARLFSRAQRWGASSRSGETSCPTWPPRRSLPRAAAAAAAPLHITFPRRRTS